MCHYKATTYKCNGAKRVMILCETSCGIVDEAKNEEDRKFYCCKPSCCHAMVALRKEMLEQSDLWETLKRRLKERLDQEIEDHLNCEDMAEKDPNCPFDHPLVSGNSSTFSFEAGNGPSTRAAGAGSGLANLLDSIE